MVIEFFPRSLRGGVEAISSKSDVHRLLILAALADAPTTVRLRGISGDIEATVRCLRELGAAISVRADRIEVCPIGKPPKKAILDCGESGSTLRFLLPVAAALGVKATFLGSGRLPERPISELKECMEQHGVAFSAEQLPFTISGRLKGGEYRIAGNVSSQYITGLLLALPLAGGGRIRLTTALESTGYVHITRSAMARFGVTVPYEGRSFFVPSSAYHSPKVLQAEGDWSNAAFFMAAGALGSYICAYGLNTHSPQGDRAIVAQLRRFGCRSLKVVDDGYLVNGGALNGAEIDVRNIPDLLPALAVVAAFAEGETRFTHASRLRTKESDRLRSTAALLNALGGEAEETEDGLLVKGVPLIGGIVDSFGDHRIAMATAIAATRCTESVVLRGAEAVNKSYPDFYREYRRLGGFADVIGVW